MNYRFLLRPKWIASHVLVMALIVTMISLGFWQLRRLDEKRRIAADIVERRAMPAEPIGALTDSPTTAGSSIENIRYRMVTVTGTYAMDDQILVSNRALDGAPGFWVVTPVDLADGTSQLVLRGWIPASAGTGGAADPQLAPLSGRVSVLGSLMRSESQGVLGTNDGANRRLDLLRLSSERVQMQTTRNLRSGFVQLVEQKPGDRGQVQITPVPLPEPVEGPHLSYAVQWFIFSLIAIVGYPLVIRRVASQVDGRGRSAPPEWES